MNKKICALPGGFSAALSFAQAKKTMSIDNFDYSTVMTAVQSIFGTQQNIGQGIQAMMTKRIAEDGRFTVVERRKANELLKEQDFDGKQPREAGHRRAHRPDQRRGLDADGRHCGLRTG